MVIYHWGGAVHDIIALHSDIAVWRDASKCLHHVGVFTWAPRTSRDVIILFQRRRTFRVRARTELSHAGGQTLEQAIWLYYSDDRWSDAMRLDVKEPYLHLRDFIPSWTIVLASSMSWIRRFVSASLNISSALWAELIARYYLTFSQKKSNNISNIGIA